MDICPSILEKKAQNYLKQIKKLSSYFNYFQIDIADGIYVDNNTASLDDFIEQLTSGNFKNFITLQTLKTLVFDFHLMVKDYKKEIEKLKKVSHLINIKNIFIHFNLFPTNTYLLTPNTYFNIGLVLNPEDKVYDLANQYNLKNIKSLQIMSVNPGAQGQSFILETLNKIEQLKKLDYRNKIFLDGAVNDKTLPIINSKKYKPDVLCPGSFLTKSPDKDLKNRVNFLLKFKNNL